MTPAEVALAQVGPYLLVLLAGLFLVCAESVASWSYRSGRLLLFVAVVHVASTAELLPALVVLGCALATSFVQPSPLREAVPSPVPSSSPAAVLS